MGNRKQPEIRFSGFSDDWEQRKLGEVTESFDGKRVPIDSGLRVSGEYPYYGATGIIDYVDDYIFDGEYVLLAEDGANITMRNYPVAYLTQGKFWLNNHAHIMRMIDGSNYFLVQILEKIDYMKYNTGTAQPKLNSKVVKNIEFKLPHVEEQRKIGSFFKQLDNTITLHQRKLDLLKEQKKGFLQKMFPKAGANTPEIRFAGFTDDWKERKLIDEVVNIGTGRSVFSSGVKKSELTPYEVLGSTSVISYASDFDHSGEFVLTARVGANAGNLYTFSGNVKISDNTVYIQASNLNFIYYLLTKFDVKRLSFGTGQPLVKASELKNLILYFPNKEEQQKISSFFKQLDDTIALNQKELDLLKETKKGFLQKMFV
ncbi:restriction endonuclease subunit S [Enterococcus sp. AZ126]|uniref:restriction endonuclease subunit S n=1 Tax=Enterococcus sp. AZ126 TaxID=2774635 RepID=UPI003F1FB856